ncbi:MAG TPA: serine hydrolase domain-containing protein [Actinomycetota bacterium]|nr:serine hydrolase domain-containing protein [Actinomycetota bacterium]
MAGAAPVAAALGRMWEARLPRLDATGAQVAITDRSGLLASVVLGAADRCGAPLSPETRFQIGSISKSFAALLALQEAEAGRLDLGAPVRRYLPWFEVPSRFAPIQVHHLLSHTSGLAQGTEFAGDARAALLLLRETEAGFAPGERFLYSNDAYKAVGLVLEEVAGRPYPELLRERVLEPLGMARSEPAITLEGRAGSAPGHRRLFDDRPDHPSQPLVEAPWVPSSTADGSVLSTAEDLCAFARALLSGGRAPGGRALLSEAALARMLEPRAVDPEEPDAPYGFGIRAWREEGRRHAGHTGSMLGHVGRLAVDLEAGVGVAVLLNGGSDRDRLARDELCRFALRAAAALAEGAEPPPPPPPPPADLVPGAEAFAGRYRAEGGGGELELVARGERLVLRWEGSEVPLEPLAPSRVLPARRPPDALLAPVPGLDRFPFRFGRDAAGRVVEVFHGPSWFRRPDHREPSPPAPDPSWGAFVGDYRSPNPWAPAFSVVLRDGRLAMVAPWLERDEELAPLGGGRFRVGAPWSPDRIRFEDVVGGEARRAVFDGAPWFRAG